MRWDGLNKMRWDEESLDDWGERNEINKEDKSNQDQLRHQKINSDEMRWYEI